MRLMDTKRLLLLALASVCFGTGAAHAGDLTIAIPRRSKSTPVQSLNQEGVECVRKHEYDKAREAFFKAYLLDPEDPFTLNNLGYMAELEGNAERAQSFYTLASQQTVNATVGSASAPKLEGESFQAATGTSRNSVGVRDDSLQINRDNFEAMHLFAQKRAMEADLLLQQTLKVDPNNGFTLNNLGVAKEMEGDFEGALKYYSAAANSAESQQKVIVTSQVGTRGRPISDLAWRNAQNLEKRLNDESGPAARAALLNFRGVAAINRNALREAADDFLQAYKADPYDAFSLNNAGYVAEMDGDLETAQSFYESARAAREANARVGLATSSAAEGLSLSAVADNSDRQVGARIEQEQAARQRETGPIELKRRDGQPVNPNPEPSQDLNSPPTTAPQ